jgi:predicted dehydrogenase
LEAAADKKHTLCEKPIAITVADVTRMIDAAETNGVKLGSSKAFIRWILSK